MPSFSTPDLFESLFALSPAAAVLYDPVRDASGAVVDLAFARLNPTAQRLIRLPEYPATTYLRQFPGSVAAGLWDFHRKAFLATDDQPHELHQEYRADSYEGFYRVAAQRVGQQLLVSFIDTHEQARELAEQRKQEAEAARAAAERQRGELQRLFEQAPVAIGIFRGPALVVELANEGQLALWNRSAAEVLGRPLFEALPEAAGYGIEQMLTGVLDTGIPFVSDEAGVPVRRGGELAEVLVRFVAQPIREADGQVSRVMAVTTEITEEVRARRQAETMQAALLAAAQRQARQRQELYQIFAQTPLAIVLLREPDHRIDYFNPAYQTLFPPEGEWMSRSVQGHPIGEVYPRIREAGLSALLDRVYQTGQGEIVAEMPLAVLQPGSPRYITFAYQAYREDEAIVGVAAFIYDVTEQVLTRQRAQQLNYELTATNAELVESEQRFRILADAAPNIVWDLTPDGSVRYVNTYCLEFLGIPLARFVADSWGPYVHPADLEPTTRKLKEAIAGGTLFSMEHRLRRHDGQYRWLRTQGNPSYYPNGALYGYVGSAIDITELVEANARLVRTNADLDTFVYTASHDLKTPITNIEGLVLALRDTLPPPVQQDATVTQLLNLLDDTVARFRTTIAQLTDLVRLQQTLAGPAEPVALAPLLAEVQADLAPELATAQATVEVAIAPGLRAHFAPASLRSIVYNLLSNAVKYRDPQRPVRVRVRAEAQPGAVVLTVQDNGLGLNESQQQRLFQVFQRLHTHVEGTGVGLYMIKRLIENGNGSITVESAPGVGSTFSVTLPA